MISLVPAPSVVAPVMYTMSANEQVLPVELPTRVEADHTDPAQQGDL